MGGIPVGWVCVFVGHDNIYFFVVVGCWFCEVKYHVQVSYGL